MIHAFSLVLDRANQTPEKHVPSIKRWLGLQKTAQQLQN